MRRFESFEPDPQLQRLLTDAAGVQLEPAPGGGWRAVTEKAGPGPADHVGTAVRRTSWTAADLLAEEFPEPRFAVDRLIPEGLGFMAGAPKLGKSWMALGLGIAIAAIQGRAFGSIGVEGGDVLYLALEDSPRRLKTRLKMLLGDDAAPSRLHIETEWPRLDEGGVERISEWLDAHPDARLILIDVWPRIRPRVTKRTDYYQADYDAAAPLQGLAISRGIALVVLFHTRKAEAEDFVETVQGTYGTAAAADTIIVVKRSRGQADATLLVTGRDVEEQELALRFDAATGTWLLLGDAAEYKLGETRRRLLDAVRGHGALTPKQAAEITGIDHDLVRQTLLRMANDGQLQSNEGRYSFKPPVTPVTQSLDGEGGSDTVTLVTLVLRDEDLVCSVCGEPLMTYPGGPPDRHPGCARV